MTAANGAPSFYQVANNSTRTEGIELAIERDRKAAEVRIDLVVVMSVSSPVSSVVEHQTFNLRVKGSTPLSGDQLFFSFFFETFFSAVL